jgi:hypothetical protein
MIYHVHVEKIALNSLRMSMTAIPANWLHALILREAGVQFLDATRLRGSEMVRSRSSVPTPYLLPATLDAEGGFGLTCVRALGRILRDGRIGPSGNRSYLHCSNTTAPGRRPVGPTVCPARSLSMLVFRPFSLFRPAWRSDTVRFRWNPV